MFEYQIYNLPMVAILKLENKKFFSDLLRVFSNKKQVTFEISKDSMLISSIEMPYIYLSLDISLYKISEEISFTIRIDELIKNINLLSSCTVILDKSFKIVDMKGLEITSENINNSSFIDIPFINPINSNYIRKSQFPTRILIPRDCLKNFMNGPVKYSISNGNLILSKQTCEYEEVLEISCDILESSHLSFYCRNDWIDSALELYEFINTVLFCFTEGLLSIKFLFKNQNSTYLEFQVLEIEGDTNSGLRILS